MLQSFTHSPLCSPGAKLPIALCLADHCCLCLDPMRLNYPQSFAWWDYITHDPLQGGFANYLQSFASASGHPELPSTLIAYNTMWGPVTHNALQDVLAAASHPQSFATGL